MRLPPMIAFVAPSGTGKTTLVEGVLRVLAARGRRVGVIKHDAHRLELDRPGKDTWRFRQAGAWRAVIAGEEQLAMFSAVDGEVSLAGLVDAHLAGVDLVLAEGFRRSGLPAIRVHRTDARVDPNWQSPMRLIAWASDGQPQTTLPVLDLNDPTAVADFLEETLLRPEAALRRATLVLPAADPEVARQAAAAAARLSDGVGGRTLLVLAPHVPAPPGVRAVHDLRPDLGPLGGLLTALAAADTPEVAYIGARHHGMSVEELRSLLTAGPVHADVVSRVFDGLADPLCAVYGHRCLTAIQGALLSGEPRMDGWWGQVRVHRCAEAGC